MWRKVNKGNAEMLNSIKNKIKISIQEIMIITGKMVRKQSKKIPNWKAPGGDDVRGFISKQLNDILNGSFILAVQMIYDRTKIC